MGHYPFFSTLLSFLPTCLHLNPTSCLGIRAPWRADNHYPIKNKNRDRISQSYTGGGVCLNTGMGKITHSLTLLDLPCCALSGYLHPKEGIVRPPDFLWQDVLCEVSVFTLLFYQQLA